VVLTRYASSIRRAVSLAAVVIPLLPAGALVPDPSRAGPLTCPDPVPVSRAEILEAMRAHGAYSLTSTTTATRFGAEALLAIVRRRQRTSPETTQLFIRQSDWFAAHLETAGVGPADMSASARAAAHHGQDILVDYGNQVIAEVLKGPAPSLALDVTLSWPDSAGAPSGFSYRDTLSVPRLEVHDERVIRFTLLDYGDMLVFDRITGLSVRPFGFMSAVFAVIGRPDLKQTRIGVSPDQWQVVRGQVRVFPGFSKTGTATIEPGGRAHEGVPAGRADLKAIADRLRSRLELRYGLPSCQAQRRMRREAACRWVMGGPGTCEE